MDILKKHRLNYTISIVLMAALFLTVIFSIFILISAATNATDEQEALSSVLDMRPGVPTDIQCFYFIDGVPSDEISKNAVIYGEELDEIIKTASETKEGKFQCGRRYFVVANKQVPGGTLYAVYDRTAHHKELIDRAIQSALMLCLALIIIGIIAYIISSKTLRPIKEAMDKQSDLIANASHELKTPLTIISANMDLLKSEPGSTVEENSESISAINSQIERMQGLIQNMLELSRMEQAEIKKEELNFSEITTGACLSFEAVCFENGTELIEEIGPDISINGEKEAIERLVIILLDNANKYCGKNGKIGVRLSQDGKKAHLAVMNTGEAISDEDAKHVFDRFYRTDGARENKNNQSFGLGLSIAYATVSGHGGTISCHGIEGKGTVFEVALPLLKQKH